MNLKHRKKYPPRITVILRIFQTVMIVTLIVGNIRYPVTIIQTKLHIGLVNGRRLMSTAKRSKVDKRTLIKS